MIAPSLSTYEKRRISRRKDIPYLPIVYCSIVDLVIPAGGL